MSTNTWRYNFITTMDTTRRSLSAAKRMPQWQRLIDTVTNAQEAAGYDGRHFGKAAMEFFGASLIGAPVERVVRDSPQEFAAYWIERQTTTSELDGDTWVRYVVKAVYGDDLARVHTLAQTEGFGTALEGDFILASLENLRAAVEEHEAGRH